MPTGENRSRSRILTAESVSDRLEEILAHRGQEARGNGAARHADRHTVAGCGRAVFDEPLGAHDIPNVLQEALQEDTYDKKLTRVCVALGLLMGALNSPPSK